MGDIPDNPKCKPLDSWDEEGVQSFINRTFASEIAKKFKGKDVINPAGCAKALVKHIMSFWVFRF